MGILRASAAWTALLAAAGLWAQQPPGKWRLGVLAGYGMAPAATAEGGGGRADTGFKPGAALGVAGGQELYEHLGGEFRYLFRFQDLKVSSGGVEVGFNGRAQAVHYDLLVLARGRQAPVRPYVAVGGGVKLYEGRGEEAAWQPLSRYAILTRTRQVAGHSGGRREDPDRGAQLAALGGARLSDAVSQDGDCARARGADLGLGARSGGAGGDRGEFLGVQR
jgi:hypothetical protein